MDKATLELVISNAVALERRKWDDQHETDLEEKGFTSKLSVDIKPADLKPMLEKRMKFHLARATSYRTDIEKFKTDHADQLTKAGASYAGGDPVPSWMERLKFHEERYGYFKVLAGNLRTDKTYRLGSSEINALELALADQTA